MGTKALTPEQRVKQREYNRKHYAANKAYYVEKAASRKESAKLKLRLLVFNYLQTHFCVDCGLTDFRVLQFDHRDEKLKTANVANLITNGYSWERVLQEIELCDVRCANCHVLRTGDQFGWWWCGIDYAAVAQSE